MAVGDRLQRGSRWHYHGRPGRAFATERAGAVRAAACDRHRVGQSGQRAKGWEKSQLGATAGKELGTQAAALSGAPTHCAMASSDSDTTELVSYNVQSGGGAQRAGATGSPPPMGINPVHTEKPVESAGVAASRRRAAMIYEVLVPHSRMPLLHRVWMTLESPAFSPAAFWYAQFSLFIITVSTVTFCLETEINCKPFSIAEHGFVTEDNCQAWENTWVVCEVVAVIAFTNELILRFISCPSKRLFLMGAMNWVDFVAILPFFLELVLSAAMPTSATNGTDAGDSEDNPLGALSVFRVIRLVRVFRVFKMGKSSSGMKMMASTMLESAKVLFVLVFMVAIAVIVYSSAVFSFEQSGAAAADFESIPRTFWWALVTMTTVGYGDITPLTPLGRLVAVVTMFSGIIIVALPITVIGSNFEKQFEKQFFQDSIVDECSRTDGTVDYDKLEEILRDLALRGNLREGVSLPQTRAELEALVMQYDVQHRETDPLKVKLDPEDWGAFIMDVVCEAHDFTEETINKVVVDVHKLKGDVASMRELLGQYQAESDHQYAQLRALLCGEEPPPPPEQLGGPISESASGGPRTAPDASHSSSHSGGSGGGAPSSAFARLVASSGAGAPGSVPTSGASAAPGPAAALAGAAAKLSAGASGGKAGRQDGLLNA